MVRLKSDDVRKYAKSLGLEVDRSAGPGYRVYDPKKDRYLSPRLGGKLVMMWLEAYRTCSESMGKSNPEPGIPVFKEHAPSAADPNCEWDNSTRVCVKCQEPWPCKASRPTTFTLEALHGKIDRYFDDIRPLSDSEGWSDPLDFLIHETWKRSPKVGELEAEIKKIKEQLEYVRGERDAAEDLLVTMENKLKESLQG